MRTDFESIKVDVTDGVATLTLSRRERLNSFTVAMHGEVRAALDAIATDRSIRCFILTGAGRGFCAGQDLSDRAVAPDAEGVDLGASIETYYTPLLQRLRELPMPTIAAVNGVAADAGANIPFACDLVFAAQSASFIQSFSKLGLVPDCGGTWWLPRLIGPARAMGLTLLGEKLTATQAAEWGLIWRCVADDELMPTVKATALQLAAGPTRGYVRTRQAIDAAMLLPFEGALDLERDYQRELGSSADYREGVTAFVQKRAKLHRSMMDDRRVKDGQAIAEAVRDRMFADDAASRGLGMRVEAVGSGFSRLSMTVRPDMLNGFKTCHGGFIATLADSAFAFACNSHNEVTVAAGIVVDFLAPAYEGDLLRAECREVALTGRTGVYDITVTNQDGKTVVVMRGRSHTIKGKAVVEL